MLRRSFIKYLLYGVSACVFSEAVYQYYLLWKRRCATIRELNDEVDEVLLVNELTEKCDFVNPHRPEFSTELHNDKKCPNPYCFPRNIRKMVDLIDKAQFSLDLSMYIFTSYDLYNAFVRAMKRDVEIRIISEKEMTFSAGSKVLDLVKAGPHRRIPLLSGGSPGGKVKARAALHRRTIDSDSQRSPRIPLLPTRISRPRGFRKLTPSRPTDNASCPIHFPSYNRMIMHHKFCLIDGPLRCREIMKKREIPFRKIRSYLYNGSMNWTHQGLTSNWENMIITCNQKLVREFENEFNRMWEAFEFKKSEQVSYFSNSMLGSII